ncbi:MAG: hydroxyacylglutathione hydrolase [Oligoflexia bacterium]|nr:hydroxyacylglutathione hydrolase [Oligoflexia bacterium]
MSQPFKIYQIPLWEDNYVYVLKDNQENKTAVIDPGGFDAVQNFLKKNNLKLDCILSTHHHWDHTGGNLKLKREWGCPIYGFKEDAERIPGIDVGLKEGEFVFVGSLCFEVLYVPSHTLGHIAFWNKENKILFCGDTVFAMGCGRLFEGSPEQMFDSLGKIKKLPEDSLIYCAHEYSLKNAQFALSVQPHNKELKARFKKISHLRKQGKATVPFYLKEELLTNPFFRAKTVSEFAKIRKLRDQF